MTQGIPIKGLDIKLNDLSTLLLFVYPKADEEGDE